MCRGCSVGARNIDLFMKYTGIEGIFSLRVGKHMVFQFTLPDIIGSMLEDKWQFKLKCGEESKI